MASKKPTLMGHPAIPFYLCDFWAVYEETMKNGILQVRGALPDGGIAIAMFRQQNKPRGSWAAHSLEGV